MKENKKEIVIINKFKENDSENVENLLEKIFEMFCNMQSVQK